MITPSLSLPAPFNNDLIRIFTYVDDMSLIIGSVCFFRIYHCEDLEDREDREDCGYREDREDREDQEYIISHFVHIREIFVSSLY